MSIQGLRKELKDLKKGTPLEKPIEVILKSDPKTLTNDELFRGIRYFHPEIKTKEQLQTFLKTRRAKMEA